jgi:lysophospholipase L1-like esterase
MSWPQMITMMFNEKVSIADYAESGLTASSFLGQRRLDMIGTVIKSGDYVLAEFGHNDQKNANDIANYCSNLTKYSALAIAHNATPLYVTPTARKTENDSTTSVGGMAQKARDCAKTNNVKVIELNAGVIALHKSVGAANVSALYASGDGTHFSDYGSLELARVVAKEIVRLNLDIAQYLRTDLPLFDPTKSDPINYLDLPCKGGVANDPSVYRNPEVGNALFSLSVFERVLHYNSVVSGKAVFTIYTLSGKPVARKTAQVESGTGSMTWREIGDLPQGIYLLKMNVENRQNEKIRFCKL